MIFKFCYVKLRVMLKSQYGNIFKYQDSYWWYKGMAAINTMLLKKFLPKNKKLQILDVGCGPGAALLYLSRFGDVMGVDLSDEALKFARKRGKVRKADISSLPFEDESFDAVVCLDVLYHEWVKDNNKALLEIKRVLKPRGIFLLREPAYNWFRSSEDIVDFTKHRFTKKEIEKDLSKSFEILKITYANFFLFPLAFMKRIPQVIGLQKKQNKSDFFDINPVLNEILFLFINFESKIIQRFNFPFGTSVVAVARKK